MSLSFRLCYCSCLFCLSTGFGLGPSGDEYADWVRARLNRVYALNRKVVADRGTRGSSVCCFIKRP